MPGSGVATPARGTPARRGCGRLAARYCPAAMAFTPMNVERREAIFPTLTEAQLERISRYGTRGVVKDGEVLYKQGDGGAHFFVVVRGELDVVQPQGEGEPLLVRHQPGNFTGETAMLAGRRALATGRVRGDG